MIFKLAVSPAANVNVKEAVLYYKKEVSLKVAQNFVLDLENTLNKIILNPFFQVYYKDFRGLNLKKYPYIVLYQVDEDKKIIFVKAVFHTYQNVLKRP